MRGIPNGELKDNQLYNGDFYHLMPLLADESIDLIIADLPYNATQCKWDQKLDLPKLWKLYSEKLKYNGVIVLFAQFPFTHELLSSKPKKFKYYDLIWEKAHSTQFLNARKRPLRSHEHILVLSRKASTYNPQMTISERRVVVKAANRKPIHSEIWNKNINFYDYDSTERYPRSVIKVKSDHQKESYHPTAKPKELVRYLIETFSNKGDLVLDNVMGAGTTPLMAIATSRKFIGIEKEKCYYNIAVARVNNAMNALIGKPEIPVPTLNETRKNCEKQA